MKNRGDRIAWISGRIMREKKGSETVSEGLRMKQRDYTRKYSLIVNACDVTVCKQMFLNTLGYTHDTILTKMFAMTPTTLNLLRKKEANTNRNMQ